MPDRKVKMDPGLRQDDDAQDDDALDDGALNDDAPSPGRKA
jgi:hypothetical protein